MQSGAERTAGATGQSPPPPLPRPAKRDVAQLEAQYRKLDPFNRGSRRGQDDLSFDVTRLEPEQWQGIPILGYIGQYGADFTIEDLRAKQGGGRYLVITRAAGEVIDSTDQVLIAGPPRVEALMPPGTSVLQGAPAAGPISLADLEALERRIREKVLAEIGESGGDDEGARGGDGGDGEDKDELDITLERTEKILSIASKIGGREKTETPADAPFLVQLVSAIPADFWTSVGEAIRAMTSRGRILPVPPAGAGMPAVSPKTVTSLAAPIQPDSAAADSSGNGKPTTTTEQRAPDGLAEWIGNVTTTLMASAEKGDPTPLEIATEIKKGIAGAGATAARLDLGQLWRWVRAEAIRRIREAGESTETETKQKVEEIRYVFDEIALELQKAPTDAPSTN